jgi:hypothetical protein
MSKISAIFTLAVLLSGNCFSALTFHSFRPSESTSGIDLSFDDFNEAYHNPDVTPRNKLMLFLPGTGVGPNVYKYFPATAAQNGFHVINLMYVNSFEFIGMAVTNDCDACYFETRTEVLTGQDLSTYETVDRNNSIEHRLIKAIDYLNVNYPAENWGQFLNGTNIVWKNLVVAGHSQGAGEAGFIAKTYAVDRAIMFDSGDWYEGESRPATWISMPGATPDIRFFGAAHTNDPLFPNPHQIPAWSAFGLTNFGPAVFVEDVTDPQFECSRMLRTAVEPRNNTGETAYHGAMVRDEHVPLDAFDVPIFRQLWEYMLYGRIVCPATFDGDSIHDLAVYHPPSGIWSLALSADGFDEIQFGSRGMIPIEADFNGDGKLDLTLYEKKSGIWYIMESGGALRTEQFGSRTSIPVPADYDGDGKTDLAVYEPSNGTWFLQKSASGFSTAQFGNRSMQPAPADYDGDGRADLGVYDDKAAMWYLLKSTEGFSAIPLGRRGSWPVHADYDGDGKTDPGCFDPRNSTWTIIRSYAGPFNTQFGYRGVVPVTRDYDGDGRDDIGVFDPISATWYLAQSRDGFRQQTFGTRKSIPLGSPLKSPIPVRGLRLY